MAGSGTQVMLHYPYPLHRRSLRDSSNDKDRLQIGRVIRDHQDQWAKEICNAILEHRLTNSTFLGDRGETPFFNDSDEHLHSIQFGPHQPAKRVTGILARSAWKGMQHPAAEDQRPDFPGIQVTDEPPLVAAISAHINKGFFVTSGGFEYTLVLGVAALTLAFTGPGSLSLDALLRHYLSGTLWGAAELAFS